MWSLSPPGFSSTNTEEEQGCVSHEGAVMCCTRDLPSPPKGQRDLPPLRQALLETLRTTGKASHGNASWSRGLCKVGTGEQSSTEGRCHGGLSWCECPTRPCTQQHRSASTSFTPWGRQSRAGSPAARPPRAHRDPGSPQGAGPDAAEALTRAAAREGKHESSQDVLQ